MEMRWEERAKRMVEIYCNNVTNPLERVCLKEDLFCPLAKLPEIVGKMVSQNGNICNFCLKYLSKGELTEIEKDCTENLVLTKGILNPLRMAGRIDVELKKVISEKPSIWQKLNTWTRCRLLHIIANHIWQNIFDALLDNPEVRKLRIILLQDLFMDDKK
jgi:hypothetical protein